MENKTIFNTPSIIYDESINNEAIKNRANKYYESEDEFFGEGNESSFEHGAMWMRDQILHPTEPVNPNQTKLEL